MNEKFCRIKNSVLGSVSRFLLYYSKYLITFSVILLICFVTGIMVCSHYTSIISVENFIDKYMLSFLRCDSNLIGFFLIHGAFFLAISLGVILLTRNAVFVIIDAIAYAIISYIFGFDVCLFIVCLGMSGVIFGILIYGIFGLLILLLLGLIMAVAIKRIRGKKQVCETYDKNGYLKIFTTLLFLGCVLIFLMALLLSIIHIFVIVD